MPSVNFSILKGQTLISIEGLQEGSDSVRFNTDSQRSFTMYHDQDCCESVRIYEIHGDVNDLLGTPILMAEEIEGECFEPPSDSYDSYTWTFYKLATIKGYVNIRWLGESNGYYSERVDFEEL